ncbi:MAG: hypothetical protein CMM25_08730 [Rhodospirillaceae bacterium]|nr:hypothetical protein [Rhodospirillaceae bacterium]
MRFVAIPHKDMPAVININNPVSSRISKIEGWNMKDVQPVPKQIRKAIVKYNPSISLIKTTKKYCEYLMWYRATLSAGKNDGTRPKTPRGHLNYKNSMWDTDWNMAWDGGGVSIIRVFEDGRVKVVHDMIPVSETTYVLDARLVFWRNEFHLIYNRYTKNGWFPDTNPELENCYKYPGKGLCITMETHPIKITKKGIYALGPPRILCRDKHTRFEKNWSLVLPVEKKRLIHYSFTPQLKFLESDARDDHNNDRCTWRVAPRSDVFMKLYSYYKLVLPPLVANGIAVTTPLIDFDKDHWIGVGRIKIDYKKLDLERGPLRNSKLGKFMNLLRTVLNIPSVAPKDWFKFSRAIHDTLVYFSFFYTINKKTLAIGQFSPAFLPQSPDVDYFATISFPVAIQPFTRGKFAVSIGIADIDCGIITISRDELRKMMIYTNRTRPQDFDFGIQTFEYPLPHFEK